MLDFTGGQSNQSFLDDTLDNFVNTKDAGLLNTLFETGSSVAGGATVARSWGGVTPLQAVSAVWAASRSNVSIPGLIGFRTLPQLAFTASVTWATNTVLLKGMYNSGVLVGSALRTGANRIAASLCSSGN